MRATVKAGTRREEDSSGAHKRGRHGLNTISLNRGEGVKNTIPGTLCGLWDGDRKRNSLCTPQQNSHLQRPVRFSTVLTIYEWNSLSLSNLLRILLVVSDRNYNSHLLKPKTKRKMTDEEGARETQRKGKGWEERRRKEAHATEKLGTGVRSGTRVTSLRLSLILLPPLFWSHVGSTLSRALSFTSKFNFQELYPTFLETSRRLFLKDIFPLILKKKKNNLKTLWVQLIWLGSPMHTWSSTHTKWMQRGLIRWWFSYWASTLGQALGKGLRAPCWAKIDTFWNSRGVTGNPKIKNIIDFIMVS